MLAIIIKRTCRKTINDGDVQSYYSCCRYNMIAVDINIIILHMICGLMYVATCVVDFALYKPCKTQKKKE